MTDIRSDEGKVRVVEVFETIQGEGPNAGLPTIFVRFAGCNLRCPLWPCDTEYAINPAEFRETWDTLPLAALDKRICEMPHYTTIPNICITGGEPFLQNHDLLEILIEQLIGDGKHIDIFTNGTVEFPYWSAYRLNITKVVDIKLPGSGEDPFKFAGFRKNINPWHINNVAKFTVADRHDFECAADFYMKLLKQERRPDQGITYDTGHPRAYVGPVWGRIESEQIVQWLIESGLPWKLNTQVHKYVWEPNTKGV